MQNCTIVQASVGIGTYINIISTLTRLLTARETAWTGRSRLGMALPSSASSWRITSRETCRHCGLVMYPQTDRQTRSRSRRHIAASIRHTDGSAVRQKHRNRRNRQKHRQTDRWRARFGKRKDKRYSQTKTPIDGAFTIDRQIRHHNNFDFDDIQCNVKVLLPLSLIFYC